MLIYNLKLFHYRAIKLNCKIEPANDQFSDFIGYNIPVMVFVSPVDLCISILKRFWLPVPSYMRHNNE